METQIVAALGAALLGLMALGIFLAYRGYRKGRKRTEAPPEPSTITAKIDTAKPRPPKVVRAPEGCKKFLTAGKEYPVIGIWDGYDPKVGYGFKITSDLGSSFAALERQCSSLNGGDWIVVEREGEEREKPSIEQQLFEAQAEATRLAGELEKEKQRADFNRAEFVKQSEMNVELLKQCNKAEAKVKELEAELIETNNLKSAQNVGFIELIGEIQGEHSQQLDQARALANDIREYLDRALAVIKIQNEQIEQLMPKRKHNLRGADGKFVKVSPYLQQVGLAPRPQPVKHLREVNAELLERPDNSEPGEQVQPAELPDVIDWTKPVAFPDGYMIPEGVNVVVVKENDFVKEGTKGKTKEASVCPYVKWSGNRVDYWKAGSVEDLAVHSDYLAPENPADHPYHPDFKGNKGNTLP